MVEQTLRELLDQLDEQIKLGPEKEALEELSQEIERHLAFLDKDEMINELLLRIDDGISNVETKHPVATGILNNISQTLSNMGI